MEAAPFLFSAWWGRGRGWCGNLASALGSPAASFQVQAFLLELALPQLLTSSLKIIPHQSPSPHSRGAVEGQKVVVLQWGAALVPLEHSPCQGVFWVPP